MRQPNDLIDPAGLEKLARTTARTADPIQRRAVVSQHAEAAAAPEHAPFRDSEAVGAQPAAFVISGAWDGRF